MLAAILGMQELDRRCWSIFERVFGFWRLVALYASLVGIAQSLWL